VLDSRDTDARNARITWSLVPGAVGHNIRWGIAPDKLYQTYQRFADEGSTEAEVRADPRPSGGMFWLRWKRLVGS
jgi:hypothetical protein